MSEAAAEAGAVIRVSGPIVEAEGMRQAGAYEVVRVGPERFIGEVIKLSGDVATIQVYEHTTGLKPGAAVERTGDPLSVVLAPGHWARWPSGSAPIWARVRNSAPSRPSSRGAMPRA